MGEISKVLGGGATLTHRDKTYRLSDWNFGIQAQFEEYLEQQAWEAWRRAKKWLSKDEHDELRREVSRDIAAGVYTFGTAVSGKALQALPHLKQLIYLMLEENHPEVTKQLVEQMVDDNLAELMQKVEEATADPFGMKTTSAAPAAAATP